MSDHKGQAEEMIRRQLEIVDLFAEFLGTAEQFSPACFHEVTTGQSYWNPDEERRISTDIDLQRYSAMWQEAGATVNPKGDDAVEMESDDDAKNYILRFEPSAAPLFDLGGLRLLPEAGGDGDLPGDLAAVEDIFCAKLGPTGTFPFGFGCLGDDHGDLCILDLSSGEDTVATGAVRFDRATGHVVVDAAQFPVDEWRFYYVGPSNVFGSTAGKRAVFAINKGQPPEPTTKQRKPAEVACQWICQGQFIDALVATAKEKLEQRRLIIRRWLLVARMELLMKQDAIPAIRNKLKSGGYEFLLDELQEIADRKLDLVKQSLTEMLPH